MLLIFLFHIIVTAGCFLAGFLFYTLIGKYEEQKFYKSFIIYVITGLVVISLFCQLSVLLFPINSYFKSAIWLLLITGGLAIRKKTSLYISQLFNSFKGYNLLFAILVFACWFMIVLISAGPTIMDDTESYHIQAIKWIQEYGTVPGLVNLHERFGFNSSWFTLVSVFIPSKSAYNYFSLMNGLLCVWLSTYLFSTLWKSFKVPGNAKNQLHPGGLLLILFFAVVCWPLLRGAAANANYDFVTTFVTIVLFLELWKNNETSNVDATELFLWPAFLFTVRITNFPFLLVSFFTLIYLIRRKNFRLLLTLTIISFSMISAFITRNIILSGYLFYPVYQIDFFSFDWKADYGATRKIATFIKYFNRVNNGFIPISETQKLSGISWVPVWFRYLAYYDKLICIGAAAGVLQTIISYKKLQNLSITVKVFLVACAIQLISWFFVAPDPRFAYGSLLIGCYLLVNSFVPSEYWIFNSRFRACVFLLLSAIIISYSTIKIVVDKNYRNLFVPARLPVPAVQIVHLNNINLHIPEKILANWNARCYGTELPCLYEIKPGLKARSNQIKDGFKIEKQ